MKRGKFLTLIIFVIVFLTSIPALAAESSSQMEQYHIVIDTVWVLITAFLVFFMQAGFAAVEAGSTQEKNTANIVMKNVIDFCLGTVMFLIIGFAFMFGLDKFGVIGFSGFFYLGNFEHLGISIPIAAFLLFQTAFAGTAATIVSGALAERTKFFAYVVASIVICSIIYPVAGHWIWGGGWLQKMGMIDFAGSTVVHSVGGWVGLIGAYLIGPRIGKYGKDGSISHIPGSNIVTVALGVFILWFGWFGFNPGSTLSAFNLDIAQIAVNTNLAAAVAAIAAMYTSKCLFGKVNVAYTLNGALAGLVAITAGCQALNTLGAGIVGLFAGILVIYSLEFIDRVLKIDDPVGAISVHAVCGVFGTLMVGLFATKGGLFYGGGIDLLITQLIGIISVFVWTTVTAYIMFKIIDYTIGLRVEEKDEEQGLDSSEHKHQHSGSAVKQIINSLNNKDNKSISAMLNLHSDDEMNELTNILNEMAQKQGSLAERLSACSESLSAHSQTLSSSSQEISSTLEEISATTNNISHISLEGTQNANQMVYMSNKVKSVANMGNISVQESIFKINNVLEMSKEMVIAIKDLNNKSQQIDQVIVVISEIANQTNLLALNAAIEASRAGNDGKGFSVIAQEIKKLADNSAKSANEVKKLIKDMQIKTQNVVNNMEANSLLIEDGTLSVNCAGKSLEEIIDEIEETNRIIVEVAEGTNLTNDGMNKLSYSTEQISQATQEMTSSAMILSHMAEELLELVSEYKLNITPKILVDMHN